MEAHATAQAVVQTLTERDETLAAAESITGGRLAALVTGVPGSSAVFIGGVVSYATEVKRQLLGVPDSLIVDHGVVSRECAVAMANGVRQLLGTTYAVSSTGVAGPGPSDGISAGTVWLGIAGPAGSGAERARLTGDRSEVQEQATRLAMELLEREANGLR